MSVPEQPLPTYENPNCKMSVPTPATIFSHFSSLVDHVAGSFARLLRLAVATSAALTTSIGWIGYLWFTCWAGIGLAWTIVSVALGAVSTIIIGILLLAIAISLLSLCCGTVLVLAALLVLFAASFLLWLARLFAVFVEDRWPNLAQGVRLDRVRRFCDNTGMLLRAGQGLGNLEVT